MGADQLTATETSSRPPSLCSGLGDAVIDAARVEVSRVLATAAAFRQAKSRERYQPDRQRRVGKTASEKAERDDRNKA